MSQGLGDGWDSRPDQPQADGGCVHGAPEGDVYDWYRRGLELLKQRNPAAAAQLLERAAAAEPTSRSITEALARAQFDTGRYEAGGGQLPPDRGEQPLRRLRPASASACPSPGRAIRPRRPGIWPWPRRCARTCGTTPARCAACGPPSARSSAGDRPAAGGAARSGAQPTAGPHRSAHGPERAPGLRGSRIRSVRPTTPRCLTWTASCTWAAAGSLAPRRRLARPREYGRSRT